MKTLFVAILSVLGLSSAQRILQSDSGELIEERELYTDQQCPNCWRAVHNRIDEMIKYNYPDYEYAFWTCCYQCYGQEGDHVPGNADDSGYHRQLQQGDFRANRYGDAGGRTWPPGNLKYGNNGPAPTYEAEPNRQCPEEYHRSSYNHAGVPPHHAATTTYTPVRPQHRNTHRAY